MIILKNFTLALNALALLSIFAFSLFVILYKAPAERAEMHKNRVFQHLNILSRSNTANVDKGMLVKAMRRETLASIEINPYHINNWILASALYSVEKESQIQDTKLSGLSSQQAAEKAELIARQLNVASSENTSGYIRHIKSLILFEAQPESQKAAPEIQE